MNNKDIIYSVYNSGLEKISLNELRKMFLSCLESADEENFLQILIEIGMRYEFFNSESIVLLAKFLKEEHWHHRHEDIIHFLQGIAEPNTISYLDFSINKRYEQYAYNNSIVIAQQSLYALRDIDTLEAFEIIKKISETDNREDVQELAVEMIEDWKE